MTIAIRFPDGTVRDVPGQLVADPVQAGRVPSFVQVPVNCDPLWHYRKVEDCWLAFARHANVSAFAPAGREWWHSIPQMDDRATDPATNAA
ncbi:MAG: hypothetical protein QHC40_06180 [Sphingobium sp.]|nr:hypothetical protein [Sphingobium sp.]